MKGQWVIVSDDGYWNDEIGWVEDKDSASAYDDNGFSLPIAKNSRCEQIVYVSEQGNWYTESDIRCIVQSTGLYSELVRKQDPLLVEEVLYEYTLNLTEWQEPGTILDEALTSDEG